MAIVYYSVPCPLGTFIDDFILLINESLTLHRILIAGDFNLDQMFPEYVAKVDPLIQTFNLSQCSQYSTQIHGGILEPPPTKLQLPVRGSVCPSVQHFSQEWLISFY